MGILFKISLSLHHLLYSLSHTTLHLSASPHRSLYNVDRYLTSRRLIRSREVFVRVTRLSCDVLQFLKATRYFYVTFL